LNAFIKYKQKRKRFDFLAVNNLDKQLTTTPTRTTTAKRMLARRAFSSLLFVFDKTNTYKKF
jgi:hypothetical protein